MDLNTEQQLKKKQPATSGIAAPPVATNDALGVHGQAGPKGIEIINGVRHMNLPDQKFPGPLSMAASAAASTIAHIANAPFNRDDRTAQNRVGLDTTGEIAAEEKRREGTKPTAMPINPASSQINPMTQPSVPGSGITQGIGSSMSDEQLRKGVRSRELGIGDFRSGTGVIVGSDGKVTRIDSQPLPGVAQPQQSAGGESILAQATRLARSSNANDRVLAAKMFRHGNDNQLKQAQAQGILAQNSSAEMLAGLEQKAIAGDQQAMTTYRAITNKTKGNDKPASHVVGGGVNERGEPQPQYLAVTSPDGSVQFHSPGRQGLASGSEAKANQIRADFKAGKIKRDDAVKQLNALGLT